MKAIKGMYVRRTNGEEACLADYKYDGEKIILRLITKNGTCHIENIGLGSLCNSVSHIGLTEICKCKSLDELFDQNISKEKYPYKWFVTFSCTAANGGLIYGDTFISTSNAKLTKSDMMEMKRQIAKINHVHSTGVVIFNIMEVSE